MRASLSRHGVDVGGDAAEGDDDGARKLRMIPLLEARSKLTPKLHKEQASVHALRCARDRTHAIASLRARSLTRLLYFTVD